ncbi:MAG: DNA repair protein RadC [Actinomycetota bacterium]|nr:DNA repair protein RadC [Actinomycetota bacterium]
MSDPTPTTKHPDTALCPRCAGEQVRVYRPGAPEHRPQITSPEEGAELLVPLLQDLDREHCVILNLDVKHRVVATTTVSIGSVDHTFMGPREVFRDALLHGAGAIVIAHNHPSGDAEPSRDDERITRRLGQAGEVLGIEVLDHIIIGHQHWVSLARRGALVQRGAITDFPDDRSESVTLGRAIGR